MRRLTLLAAALAAIFAFSAIPAYAGGGEGEHCTEEGPAIECRGGGGSGGQGLGGGGGGNTFLNTETGEFSFRGGEGFGGSGEGRGGGGYCFGTLPSPYTCHGKPRVL